jgi:hypothetical protein
MSWDEFEKRRTRPTAAVDAAQEDLDRIAYDFAVLFRGNIGEKCLAWLRSQTKERVVLPTAPDSVLRDMEGQRRLLAKIEDMITRGNTVGEAGKVKTGPKEV